MSLTREGKQGGGDEVVPAYFQVELLPIPKLEGDPTDENRDWHMWCVSHGVNTIYSERRGWWSDADSYIDDAAYAVMINAKPVRLITSKEREDWTLMPNKREWKQNGGRCYWCCESRPSDELVMLDSDWDECRKCAAERGR